MTAAFFFGVGFGAIAALTWLAWRAARQADQHSPIDRSEVHVWTYIFGLLLGILVFFSLGLVLEIGDAMFGWRATNG